MINTDKENNFLIKVTEGLYRKTLLPYNDPGEMNIDKFIQLALKNNLLYYSAKEIVKNASLNPALRTRFETIISEGAAEFLEIGRSIDEIKKHISDYIIFKTYRGEKFLRIGNDVDVLVTDDRRELIKNEFINLGYSTEYDDPKEKSVGLLKTGQKKIHLQGGITWCWEKYLDDELIHHEPRKVSYNGQEIPIPNVNADFLIHLAHMNFEPLFMLYSELLYLFKLVPEVDFALLLEQTRKYNWQRTFLRTINLINNIHLQLYGELCCHTVKFKHLAMQRIIFPYEFSRMHLFRTVLEKKLFLYSLTKISKIINLFIIRDAYQYIDSPERKMVTPAS